MTPTTNTLPEIAGIPDVCRAFGVTRGTLNNWIASGRFPKPTRPCGSHRGKAYWSADAVRAVLTKGKQPEGQAAKAA